MSAAPWACRELCTKPVVGNTQGNTRGFVGVYCHEDAQVKMLSQSTFSASVVFPALGATPNPHAFPAQPQTKSH